MSHASRADELDGLLRHAATVSDGDIANADLEGGYQALHENLVRHLRAQDMHAHREGRRRTRKTLLLGGAVTAAAVFAMAPTGAAAAGWFSAHTGWFGSPGATENGTGELLDTGARDFPHLARQLAAGISFPPGDGVNTYIARMQAATREDAAAGRGRTLMEDAGVRQYLRGEATCAWSGYWLDAYDAGDTTREAAAVQGLSDPPPQPAYVAAAARRGDSSPVRSFWTANCAELPRLWRNQ